MAAAAHLLQSHSEQAHYSLFFLDYVGVAVYQYGCALALCLYSSNTAWRQSMLGQRRPAMVREFGEERLLLACASFPCLTLCCALTALAMRRQAQAQLMKEQR
ncbi:membrane progestin receptor alpha-like [Neolamprologus brichardi]|uniref:membrane progestin receptor alpha-like n=1 Tax=Neolamprologus brichardi TaxID=32507 RepID=UPI001643D4FA|nr:membrane progestin receptor alpha-like [Neolamprologus brichardi]